MLLFTLLLILMWIYIMNHWIIDINDIIYFNIFNKLNKTSDKVFEI